jgi:hypothetical protein
MRRGWPESDGLKLGQVRKRPTDRDSTPLLLTSLDNCGIQLSACLWFERFESYCEVRAFKKSTLIAPLIRDHLDKKDFQAERRLPPGD